MTSQPRAGSSARQRAGDLRRPATWEEEQAADNTHCFTVGAMSPARNGLVGCEREGGGDRRARRPARRRAPPAGRCAARPPTTSDVEPPPSRLSAASAPSRPASGQLVERQPGFVVGAAVAGHGDQRAGGRAPSAARGWRPTVMSESNCPAPAEKPSSSVVRDASRRAPAADRPAADLRRARSGSSLRRAIRTPPSRHVHTRTPRVPRRAEGHRFARRPAAAQLARGMPLSSGSAGV